MKVYTKKSLIAELKKIRKMGWIENARPGNQGGVGNTLEDLLEIKENNLPLPNAGEWEIKCQRTTDKSLTTLFHMEPSPRACNIVPSILLLKYGWRHQKAGLDYPEYELSFRQTIYGPKRTDRGFAVLVNREAGRVEISFNNKDVAERHAEWIKSVKKRVGLGELDPQPYWGFNDLIHKAGSKLHSCFYIKADCKKEDGIEHYSYGEIFMLEKIDLEKFLAAIERGIIAVDFDARTGHNHGTKFRMIQGHLPDLYEKVTRI